jgi:MFS family permease
MAKKTVLLLCSMLTILAGTIISPALPKIEEIFTDGRDISLIVSLILTLTSLAIAIAAPIAGSVADKVGRKPLLLASLFLYGLAGGVGVLLGSLEKILISRIFLGLAVAGVMTSATTLIGDYYVEEEREKVMGLQAACIAAGGAVFLISGGLLASVWWRAPFFIYFLSWPLFIAAYFIITEPASPPYSGQKGQKESLPWLSFLPVVSTVLLGMMVYFFIPTQLPFYLYKHLKLNSGYTGMYMAASILFATLTSLGYQWFHQYLSKVTITSASFFLMGLGFKSIYLFPQTTILLGSCAITGLGFGLILPNCTVWTTEIAPESLRGRMLGGLTASLFLGQFFSTLAGKFIKSTTVALGPSGIFNAASIISLILAVIYGSFSLYKRNTYETQNSSHGRKRQKGFVQQKID